MRQPCAILQGAPSSHAWGGLHAANYASPSDIAPGGIDPPGTEPDQRFIYEFQLLRAREPTAAAASSAESPGLMVTLAFPVPVVIKAMYGGYGATDLTRKPIGHGSERGYESMGSMTVALQLCGEARFYSGDACPTEAIGGDEQSSVALEKLQLQGERRSPLNDDEVSTSIMPVSVLCESKAQHTARLVRLSTPPSPPPPSPAPLRPPPLAYEYDNELIDDASWDWASDPRVTPGGSSDRGSNDGIAGGQRPYSLALAQLQRWAIDPMTTTPSHFTSQAIIVAHLEARRSLLSVISSS